MNILDPKFKYTSAAKTDIRKTFARERKRIAEEKERLEQERLEKIARTITPFRGR